MKTKQSTTKVLSIENETSHSGYARLAVVFEFNERVIWNSGFGYEIGYFLGEGNQYDTYLIDIRTGLIHEPCSHSISEIFKYSNEEIDKLTKKYGYEKRFSDTF